MTTEIIKELIEENTCFIDDNKEEKYKDIQTKQTPQVTAVLCADSRVPTCVVQKDTTNKVFCIENIGNQIKTAEGSVDYGVLHLKTPVLLILGHTECGAVKASFSDYSNDTEGIKKELDQLKNGLKEMGQIVAEDDKDRFTKYAQLNVDYQIKVAVEKYKDLIESGKLTVVGKMMDFVGAYGGKTCENYIININGETDVEKIVDMDVLSGIDSDVVKAKVKRV